MTARPQDVALLPLPWCLLNLRADDRLAVQDYARACVEANVGQLRAEVERLRASIQSADNALTVEGEARADAEWKVVQLAEEVLAARARAERLAEALREAQPFIGWTGSYPELHAKIDALLTTNAAQPGETV